MLRNITAGLCLLFLPILLSGCGICINTCQYLATGELDTAFSSDGLVYFNNPLGAGTTTNEQATQMIEDNQGRLLLFGHVRDPATGWDLVVYRFNSDGSVDTSFAGGTGFYRYSLAFTGESAGGISVDSQDRIVISGSTDGFGGANPMVIIRLLDNGTLDTSFNSGGGTPGVFTSLGESGVGIGNDHVIASDGSIYVSGATGSSLTASTFDLQIWKLTPNGVLDTSFAGNGMFIHSNAGGGSAEDQGYEIEIDSSGNVVVAGRSAAPSSLVALAVWRVTSTTGVLDTSFNGTGFFTWVGDVGITAVLNVGLVVDSAGSLYASTTGATGSATNIRGMSVFKLIPSGTLDSTFGNSSTGGIFSTNNTTTSGTGITLDCHGNILVTGFTDSQASMTVWRVLPDGSALDSSFGTSGALTDSRGNNGVKIGLDANQRILVGGKATIATLDGIAGWRVL